MASEPLPFNFNYPTVSKSSKIKEESYDRLDIYIKHEGYKYVYGHIWRQKFNYPKFKNNTYQKALKDFFVKSLELNASDVTPENYLHFRKDNQEYWLKFSIYATSYNYELLRIETYPQSVSFDNNRSYLLDKKFIRRFGKVEIPKHLAIPHVKEYSIERYSYYNYDEHTFYYGKKAHIHKGKFWKINFNYIGKSKESHRYSLAHDYTTKILKLGAIILKDEDNTMLFQLKHNGSISTIKLESYNRTFSLTIVQEEYFKQSLVLTPDNIKAELDKTGKITLDGIFFEFNKATLKPESEKAILSSVALMQHYSDLVLSVNGYTDNRGSESYNNKLSKERAAAVRNAIIAEGIESKRLQYNGYGEKNPIASNDTDDGRAKNRRVELHKVSGGNKKSIITIDFIKPIENSVIASQYEYDKGELSIHYTKPYASNKKILNYKGHLKTINYQILKDKKIDTTVSRKEIIKNYENILELYSAEIIGKSSNSISFKIKDRGDGVSVYGRIDAYSGKYSIYFLIAE